MVIQCLPFVNNLFIFKWPRGRYSTYCSNYFVAFCRINKGRGLGLLQLWRSVKRPVQEESLGTRLHGVFCGRCSDTQLGGRSRRAGENRLLASFCFQKGFLTIVRQMVKSARFSRERSRRKTIARRYERKHFAAAQNWYRERKMPEIVKCN